MEMQRRSLSTLALKVLKVVKAHLVSRFKDVPK